MRKIFFVLAIVFISAACTKHDPFDNLDGEAWILSLFAQDNYQNESGDTYFSYEDMKNSGLLSSPVKEGSRYYRVPTSGELQMIFPECQDREFLSQYNMYVPLNFVWAPVQGSLTMQETACLENKDDGSADRSGEVISGESEFYYAEDYEDDDPDFIPNFALRFKGTSQYAAYMYQIKLVGEGNDRHYVLSLKAKWLKAADVTTTIEDIIKPEYWVSGYLSLEIPFASYIRADGTPDADISGRLNSSTLRNGASVVGYFDIYSYAGLFTEDSSCRCPLRLIRCYADGTL